MATDQAVEDIWASQVVHVRMRKFPVVTSRCLIIPVLPNLPQPFRL